MRSIEIAERNALENYYRNREASDYPKAYYTWSEIENTYHALNLPTSWEDVRELIQHENFTSDLGVEVEFSGTFQGIGQFNRRTWEGVSDMPWSSRQSLVASLRAISLLWESNKRVFLNQFKNIAVESDFSFPIGYTYHNQGAGAAAEFLRTGVIKYPKQSSTALATLRQAFDLFA